MGISVRFTSGSQVNGLSCLAFERSQKGLGFFFNFLAQSNVANDSANFPTISPSGEYAFRLDSASGTRWRSGPLLMQSQVTDTFWVLDAGTLNFSPDALNARLPTPPIVSGAATIDSITLSAGTESLSAAGTGRYATLFGSIPISYTYVFTLLPVTDPADMRFPGGIPPVLSVRTVSVAVTAAAGGLLGFLINFLASVLFDLFQSSIRVSIERTVQASVDSTVAGALAAQSAPPGTIASVETVSIAPIGGISMRAFAGVAMEKLCPATPSGGSVRIRSQQQLQHLRLIRDRLLTRSPQGLAYIELFEHFSEELTAILLTNDELLNLADAIAAGVLERFPKERPGAGVLTKHLADQVLKAIQILEHAGSPELTLTIRGLRDEVRSFVDRPAEDVLAESMKFVTDAEGGESRGRMG